MILISINVFVTAADLFSNSFLVRFKRNVELDEAHIIAKRNGFVNMGPVSSILLAIRHSKNSCTRATLLILIFFHYFIINI